MVTKLKSKPELVALTHTSFHSESNCFYFEKYFNLTQFDENIIYGNDVIFVYNHSVDLTLLSKYSNTHKMICDLCWESPSCDPVWYKWISSLSGSQNHLVLKDIDKFFWFNEKNLIKNNKISISFKPGDKRFLMPIRKQTKNRDMLFDSIDLSNSIYSYVERGITLEKNFVNDRFYDPSWYSQTQYSVVCETYQTCIFPTEKTFKPIMYGHPFIFFAGNGHLNYIKQCGFESYDCVFDESYDSANSIEDKIKIICNNIKDIEYTPEICNKLMHNRQHFHNSNLPEQSIYSNVVEPTLEYIHD